MIVFALDVSGFGAWILICDVVLVFFSSVLKEMVRDLEQIKENGESQLIAKKEKCSSHVNANGQHCECSMFMHALHAPCHCILF